MRHLAYLWAVMGCLLSASPARGAFGVTSSGGYYTVDTAGGLVFKVNQANGDITSLNFNGTEYQATDKNSQIASGLGSATVNATTYGTNCVLITLFTGPNNSVVTNLTHYLMVQRGVPTIYMATYVLDEPSVGELRWITRLQWNKVPHGPPESDNNGNTGAIESSDVFGHADGTSTSKYYGRQRAMELTYSGASGAGIGVWMVFDTRESSSGGPFYRDIENQGDGTNSDQEVYNYMNSGHEQTEPWRLGGLLYGRYALVFNTGAAPAVPPDYSWIESSGLSADLLGWVTARNRGTVAGVVSGIPAGFQGMVGFANTNAQYWAVATTNGTYTSPLMKPGDYTVTLYKTELPVAGSNVTVTAGTTTPLNLASAETAPTAIFRIGEWDGTPAGFLNAGNIVNMHPSDIRCTGPQGTNWGPLTFTVGASATSNFPTLEMRGTNNPVTILFSLTASQVATMTLRIGMTCAYNNGRPQISINGYSPAYPGASSQPNSRSFTTGTWRGNQTNESYYISSGHFLAGLNTLTISPVSGNADLGPWLSAGWVFDAVDLIVLNTGPAIPAAPTSLAASALNGTQIRLAWNDHATNAVNYLVERAPDNVNFSLIAAPTATATNYNDTGLTPASTYYYRVRAANAAGYSSYTPTASATTAIFQFGSSTLAGGANVSFTGAGGTPGGGYTILSTTNLHLPLAQWTHATTGTFDGYGNFSNNLGAGGPQMFYRVRTP